jgi:hypothetical protein
MRRREGNGRRREERKEKEEKCRPGESIYVNIMTIVTPKI